ncbi:MAG: PmoA family protein [Armatimonadota bacterium]|nr:PmoA family protein [Armatimonadota bacterium]
MLLAICSTICHGSDLEVKVRLLPEHSGAVVPVSVKLDAPVPDPGLYCLRDASRGKRLPFQYDRSVETIEFMVDVPEITKPVTRVFRLTPGAPAPGDGVRVRNTADKSLVVEEGDKRVLVYNYGSLLPQGLHRNYRRSCYIHPVFGPRGESLTDDFPADHYHHRGIAVMWTHVIVGGRDYDLWGLSGIKPRFSKVLAMEDGPVYSLLRVNDGWYTDEGNRVVDETWTVKTYRSGEHGRIVDFDILLKAVGEPVTLRSSDRGYGGFNVRFAPREDTVVFSEKGEVPADADKESYLWNDLSAKFKGADAISGLAVFDNPGNVRHPQPWTNRRYGLLNPAPAAIERLTITADQPLRLRYRVWIHKGDVNAGKVAQAYRAYVNPPVVETKGDK